MYGLSNETSRQTLQFHFINCMLIYSSSIKESLPMFVILESVPTSTYQVLWR